MKKIDNPQTLEDYKYIHDNFPKQWEHIIFDECVNDVCVENMIPSMRCTKIGGDIVSCRDCWEGAVKGLNGRAL